MAGDRKTCSVYFYIPNIIGYVRILLALLSFYYMPTDHVRAGILYTTSCLLDAFDGYAARYFNQVSLFGAVLDLITDRVIAPVGLLVTLSILYPTYSLLFQLFLVLDISSHWLHLHSSILTGKQSHKTLDKDANALMKFYYSNRIFLFSMAAGNELFFVSLYLLYFTQGPLIAGGRLFIIMAAATAPVAALKLWVSVIQLKTAVTKIVKVDGNQKHL